MPSSSSALRYREAHREEAAARSRAWQVANPERAKATHAAYYVAHREGRAATNAAWWVAHPDCHRAKLARRRAAKRQAEGAANGAQIAARWIYYGDKCWICGGIATATDHVKPLSKGGSNWPANLRPVCLTCNSSKKAKWPFTMAA